MKGTVHVNGGSSSTDSGQDPQESNSLGRPDAVEPGIYCRGAGRQLLISTGKSPSPVDTEPPEPDDESSEDGESDTPTRGKIQGRSEDSRRRLRERLHAMRRGEPGVFTTLTLHETDPDPSTFKGWQESFWKRVRREYEGEHVSNLSCVWVLEPHTEGENRGKPHVHMIVWGVPYMDAQKLSRLWHEVTDEASDEHRKAGVDVESAVNQDGKLQSYLAKYMSKTFDGWPDVEPGDPWATPGRFWGFMGRDHLPVAEWEDTVVKLNQKQAMHLIDWLLDDWEVDIPEGVTPPTLIINCRGNPGERLLGLIDQIPEQ
jgi:hypothetical protein